MRRIKHSDDVFTPADIWEGRARFPGDGDGDDDRRRTGEEYSTRTGGLEEAIGLVARLCFRPDLYFEPIGNASQPNPHTQHVPREPDGLGP